MERIFGTILITLFAAIGIIGMSLHLFVDDSKVGRLKKRSILLFGPFVPEEILSSKGVTVAKIRNILALAWIVLAIVAGVTLNLRHGN